MPIKYIKSQRSDYNNRKNERTLNANGRRKTMKIDVTKIEGYENMSAEEKLAALEGFEIEDSDTRLKDALNKATAEASKYKKELREKQTEQERLDAERKEEMEKRDAQLAELLREKTVAEHKANFLKVGYSEELADESAKAIADGDYAKIFNNLGVFLTEKEKTIKEELLKQTPKPSGGFPNQEITKEQFEKMSYGEKAKLYETNKALYDSLKGE